MVFVANPSISRESSKYSITHALLTAEHTSVRDELKEYSHSKMQLIGRKNKELWNKSLHR